MQENNIGVAILFYNKLHQTIDSVNSFLPSGLPIYILNNGSDPGQWDKLKQEFSHSNAVDFLDAGANLGVSGGRNFLIQHTKEQWLLFVDNDITIRHPQAWLSAFDSFLKNNPAALIVCPRLFNIHENAYSPKLKILIDGRQVRILLGDYTITNCFPGGASFVHRTIFDNYGLYDEKMFVGFEDYEFALRAAKSAYGEFKVVSCDAIELLHDHRIQYDRKDKEAVRKRYDEDRLKASYQHLVEKYNIVFDHEWEWWCRKQVTEMTGPGTFQKIKNRLKGILSS
jgi:GT2 family glycosyltransferase